ncbi:MAG: hypothetical protein IT470_07710 [Pseudomonadales bacterium]|nr:hypothetical protein [Pseudomonadales bacterium]
MITAWDDYAIHQAPEPINAAGCTDENFYDRYFFSGFSKEGDYYFGIAMGLYPNRHVQDAHFSIAIDGRQHSFHISASAGKLRSDNRIGPMNIEVVEPMRVLRVTLDANTTGIAVDLTFTACTVPLEEPRSVMKIGSYRLMDTTRFAQFGSWRGWIKIGEQHIAIGEEALGVRDRSWGVRPSVSPTKKTKAIATQNAAHQWLENRITRALFPPQRPLRFREKIENAAGLIGGHLLGVEPGTYWLWNLNFFDDICTHFGSFETLDGEPSQCSSAILPRYANTQTIPQTPDASEVQVMEQKISWRTGTRTPQSACITLEQQQQALAMQLTPRIKFHLSGLGYGHPKWIHGAYHGREVIEGETWLTADYEKILNRANNHIQQMCDVRMGDKKGVGILESLCVGAYQPAGFQQRFDGAPTF